MLKFPSNILVVGKQYSGKSFLVMSILSTHIDEFKNIIIICPTLSSSDYLPLKEKALLTTDISEKNLETICNGLEKSKQKTLMVWDDILSLPRKLFDSKIMRSIVCNQRHNNLTNIFCSQYFNSLPKYLRCNMTYFIFKKMIRADILCITDQICPGSEYKKDFSKRLYHKTLKIESALMMDERESKEYELTIYKDKIMYIDSKKDDTQDTSCIILKGSLDDVDGGKLHGRDSEVQLGPRKDDET